MVVTMAAPNHTKIKLREVNRHLVCRLCRGYYVDATTIAECLHSFCRSCIIKYLEKNSFCPICEVQIHKTKPYLNLRLDKALQDVVYKVVPGLYHNEMRRRREFYARCQEQIPFATPEQCGVEERIIFSPEDSISLSLEYFESDDFENETVSSQSSESGDSPDILSFPPQLGLIKMKSSDGKISRRESQDVQETSCFPKRYLQCPAVVNIGHLKKFIRMKHELTDKMQVSVIHKRVPLPDHYTLMDVAYIFTWKRSAPLRFFYQIYQTKKQKLKIPPPLNEAEAKSQCASEELKSVKNAVSDKISNGDIAKSFSDANKNIKIKSDKNETVVSEIKDTIHNNVLKNVDSNKPVAETKSETSVKSEPSVNGFSPETKEGFESTCNTGSKKHNNKSEKFKSNGANTAENKNKIESQRRKSVKIENNLCSAREVKENEFKNNERLLLNPISGQLESVPSNDQCKSNVNGAVKSAEKKEIVEISKKESTNKSQKKTESQSSKDSRKSNVNLLKSFRKEKSSAGKGDEKVESKNIRGNSVTITAVSKNDKPPGKETAKFHVEIKSDNKASEYDFDGSSPPGKIIPLQEFSKYSKYSKYMAEHRDKWLSKESKNKWMSLQDFREKMLKENESNQEDPFKKMKKKVPCLYKINSEGNKSPPVKKTPNGKHLNEKLSGNKTPPVVMNVKTECKDSKVDDILTKRSNLLKPVKIENKDGEYSVKPAKEKKSNAESSRDKKLISETPQPLGSKPDNGTKHNDLTKAPEKRTNPEKTESENSKNITKADKGKNEITGAIDLTRTDTKSSSEKNSLENLSPSSNKTNLQKSEEKMMEALMSAAQNQSIEPLLKIPKYSQMVKNSVSQGSLSPGKNISSNEISQALQFLDELKSDIKVFESKSKLNPNSVFEQFAQKSGNFEPYQQLYQQKIDLIRRLKRHQQTMPGDQESPQIKQLKLSPTSESKKKLSPSSEQKAKTSPVSDETAQSKASLDRTLSQIQFMELQSRMFAAQNYKNLPALLRYCNRSPIFCAGPTSPSKSNQQKIKSSSHSPTKSPQSLSSSSGNSPLSATNADSSFFNSQSYNHLINAGLNSEMTYHQMFQSYLNQQEQMNQVKLSQLSKKPVKFCEISPKSISDKYYSPQMTAKKQEPKNSPPSDQKS